MAGEYGKLGSPQESGQGSGRLLTIVIFFTLGVGSLFAWNSLITAAVYFAKRFCGSPFLDSFENGFSISYMSSNIIALALAVRFEHLVPRKSLLLASFGFYFLIFATIAIMVLAPDMDSSLVFFITIGGCISSGLASAGVSRGVFGMVGQFPGEYIAAVMSGQGLAGLIAAMVSLATALFVYDGCEDEADDSDDSTCTKYTSIDWGSFAYFAVACLIFLACITGYIILETLPLAKHYDRQQTSEAPASEPTENLLPDDQDETGHADGTSINTLPPSDQQESFWETAAAIKNEAFSVFGVFAVTLALFPSISVKIETSCDEFPPALFIPYMFILFNLFDLVGRSSAGWIDLIPKEYLLVASFSRLIFVPLFLLCDIEGSRMGDHVIFDGAVWPSIFMILMALSNGYVSTLAMIKGPTNAPNHQERAGGMMIFALTAGLFAGSCFSYLALYGVTGSV